ncbi:MAG TPA: bifunctional UDP-N-acetylglucosamine diphosphorylase/glucosamine-1-phosphate N-acetyltransferase GlmU [Clostridiales bacterium UBA8153]|nr:bifunctional UDP-N-acetylglucosamine diphosphorylase/glucosamine-1-phosphate N-acetyltransferase GlmU [Clostridiales bacterium UBA8153]
MSLPREVIRVPGDWVAVILAAGQGKRMNSGLVKGLHALLGRPMVWHVVRAVREAGVERVILVVGYQEDRMRTALGTDVEYAVQKQQLGTGHALLQTRDRLEGIDGDILVVCGDTPLLDPQDLRDLMAMHRQERAAATILTALPDDPSGFGRVVRSAQGTVQAVVEERDASSAQRAIGEVNTGIYCFRAKDLFPALLRLGADNVQGEYYLTDVLSLLAREDRPLASLACPDPQTVANINDRVQLSHAAAFMQHRRLVQLARSGVTIWSFSSTFVGVDVTVGQDTVLLPMTFLEGECAVGRRCVIGPNVTVKNAVVGDDCQILQSVVEASRVDHGVTIGPFTHIRPGSHLRDGVKVGNFAELKNAFVDVGSKIPHHSYIGDAQLGKGVNIGAGAITVNYDGRKKHNTTIGDAAFIGCNSNLIAPVAVGPGAYVAAGSTVNQEVPPGALAVARSRQVNKPGWAGRHRE